MGTESVTTDIERIHADNLWRRDMLAQEHWFRNASERELVTRACADVEALLKYCRELREACKAKEGELRLHRK